MYCASPRSQLRSVCVYELKWRLRCAEHPHRDQGKYPLSPSSDDPEIVIPQHFPFPVSCHEQMSCNGLSGPGQVSGFGLWVWANGFFEGCLPSVRRDLAPVCQMPSSSIQFQMSKMTRMLCFPRWCRAKCPFMMFAQQAGSGGDPAAVGAMVWAWPATGRPYHGSMP